MAFARSTMLLLSAVVVVLLAIVGVSLHREFSRQPISQSATVTAAREVPAVAPPALTADEETFVEALWPLHQEIVEASAGRLSSAGLAFAIDDHDAHRLAEKVKPLRQVFHDTRDRVAAIPVPASLRVERDRYISLLDRYEQSATEMLEVDRDGDEGHLINAQEKSEHAAEELVKVGDILWPGEHKPN